MNLYIVYNGFCGFDAVHCHVVAMSETRAKELAEEKFKKESGKYGERYWNNLTVLLICENCNVEHVTEIQE